MNRARFVPPRLAGAAATAAQPPPPPPPAAQPLLAVFDCLLTRRGKRGGSAVDGTLVLTGSRAQLFDLMLKEHAAGPLSPVLAAALHAAHAGAIAALAAGQPLGPLWGGDSAPEGLAVDGWRVELEDDRAAAVRPAEWALRQRVAAEARGGKPKDAVGAALPDDSLGGCWSLCVVWVGAVVRERGSSPPVTPTPMHFRTVLSAGARMLAGMGWQPGRGLGRQPGGGGGLVLPALKRDKVGLGASAHVKRLGVPRTIFRRAAAAAGGGAGAAVPQAAAGAHMAEPAMAPAM